MRRRALGVNVGAELPHVALAGALEAGGQAVLPVNVGACVAHAADELHLLREPRVQTRRPHLRQMHAHRPAHTDGLSGFGVERSLAGQTCDRGAPVEKEIRKSLRGYSRPVFYNTAADPKDVNVLAGSTLDRCTPMDLG